MERVDGRRLKKFLGLSAGNHEIVMVIAIGKASAEQELLPQWRRPLDSTATVV